MTVDDLIIIGGGPTGIAAGLSARQAGKKFRVLEQGTIAYTIYRFPIAKKLFSTTEHLELTGYPFVLNGEKPTREDLLQYYVQVVHDSGMQYQTREKVQHITPQNGAFHITTERDYYRAARIVLATGVFEHPRRLRVPGEDLDKVYYRFHEAWPFFHEHVLVVGGRNSAVEAALFLAEGGARVTMAYRREDFFDVKPWILPQLRKLEAEGRITVLYSSHVVRIGKEDVELEVAGAGRRTLPNDAVFCMTYSEPDVRFLQSLGLALGDDKRPVHDPETFESTVPGIFISGTLACEMDIRESRNHGARILEYIEGTEDR